LHAFLVDEFHGNRRQAVSFAEFDVFLKLPSDISVPVDFEVTELVVSSVVNY
jgi:hypothetical protein